MAQETANVLKDKDAKVNKLGTNGKAAQGSAAVNAACTDLPTVVALCNQIRALLIANGIAV